MEEKKELLDQDERVVESELERLRGFVNHPFKVQADSQMIELQESIKKYANDAGAGVFSPKDAVIRPGDICKLPLGFGLKIPDGYAGYIFPRSGLSSQGIVCELPPIDSGYTGEVHAIISNVENREYEIKMGDKVGQLVIMPVLIPDFTFENWKERGTGAFGSTER